MGLESGEPSVDWNPSSAVICSSGWTKSNAASPIAAPGS